MDTPRVVRRQDPDDPAPARGKAVRTLSRRWYRYVARFPARVRNRRAGARARRMQERTDTFSCADKRGSSFDFLRSVGHENVPLVAYGPDEPRMVGIGLDLLAQTHDAQIHAAVEWVPIPFLVEIQDAFARQRPIGVFRKRLEQVELQRGHRDLFALLIREPVCSEVEHASSDA